MTKTIGSWTVTVTMLAYGIYKYYVSSNIDHLYYKNGRVEAMDDMDAMDKVVSMLGGE
jgi:hypothetical protein